MKISNFWILAILFITASLYAMEDTQIPIITINGNLRYKCPECNYRPVRKKESVVTHWLLAHPEIENATIKKWQKKCVPCPNCTSHHPNKHALALHRNRNHRTPHIHPPLEEIAPEALMDLYQKSDNLLILAAACDAKMKK